GSTSYRTRLSLMILSRKGSQHRVEVFRPRQRHLQEGQGQALALRVRPERFARSATEHVEQNEVQRLQVRGLVANHPGRVQRLEVVGDRLASQVLAQPGEARFGVGDHRDVRVIALVAAASVGNIEEWNWLSCVHGSGLTSNKGTFTSPFCLYPPLSRR